MIGNRNKRTVDRTVPREERPEVMMSSLVITGSRVGALIGLGLGIGLFLSVPPTRPFLLGAIGLGALIGLILWWKHR